MKLTKLASFTMMAAFVATPLFSQRSHNCGSKVRNEVSSKEHHEITPEDMTDEQKRVVIRQQRIMSDMRALDTYVQALISKMNEATGVEKTDAIADVVNELVWQRTQIHEEIMALQSKIIGYIENRVGTGMSHGMHSAEDCPMMQMMTDPTGGEPNEEAAAHHH